MKTGDIRIGAVLYWNDHNEWLLGKGTGWRVVVIENTLGHWYLDKGGNHHDHGSKVQNPYGLWTTRGVVVEVQGGVGNTRKAVVPVGQLRGTWEDCQLMLANVAEARAKAQAAAQAEADRQEAATAAARARGRAAMARLEAWGIRRGRDASVIEGSVTIRAEVLEALMDALPHAWHYDED